MQKNQTRMPKLIHLAGKAGEVFSRCVSESPPAEDGARDFICFAWEVYQTGGGNIPAITGRVFEYLVAHALLSHGIKPLHYQAKFALVPNADFDIVLYDLKRPIILTLKTTLRERYKQADLEGSALKQVYRGAECILVTLSSEGENVASKIEKNDVSGLDRVVIVQRDRDDFDDLIEELKQIKFSQPEPMNPMRAERIFE